MFSENAETFFGHKVKDFTSADDWQGAKFAYRLRTTWDDPADTMIERLDELANHKDAGKLEALVIGAWNGDDSSRSSEPVINALVERKERFAGLKALFLGDITYEENEVSWIQQSNVTPLLRAFLGLQLFRVRGGNGLKFSQTTHEALQQLIVETGGLPRSAIRGIWRCDFPKLKRLELWLGVENYGFDGGVEDLQPLLAGKCFPKLEYLGLRNSDIVDEIAPVVVNAPILKQLKVLDLSNGTLSDVGAAALLNLPKDLPLQELNLSHHYMAPGMVKQLKKALKYKIVADDPQDPNEEWRSVVVSE